MSASIVDVAAAPCPGSRLFAGAAITVDPSPEGRTSR